MCYSGIIKLSMLAKPARVYRGVKEVDLELPPSFLENGTQGFAGGIELVRSQPTSPVPLSRRAHALFACERMQNLHRLLPSLQVRGQLRLKERKLSDKTLKAVWRALDADGSDRLSVGEFGAFMRLHEFESDARSRSPPRPRLGAAAAAARSSILLQRAQPLVSAFPSFSAA